MKCDYFLNQSLVMLLMIGITSYCLLGNVMD